MRRHAAILQSHPVAPKSGATRVGQPQLQIGKGWAGPGLNLIGQRGKSGAERTRSPRSQNFINRTSLATLVFALGFTGETSQLILCARQFFLPGGLVLESFENLRGDRVLLLLRKSSHFAQSVFQQLGHKPSLAEHLKGCKNTCIPSRSRRCYAAGCVGARNVEKY